MKKQIIASCIMVFVALYMTSCGVAEEKNNKEVDTGKISDVGALVMGGEDPEMQKEYDAKDIPAITLNDRYLDKISDLMEGKECQSLIMDGVKSLVEDLDDTWKNNKKFYVTKRAIYGWSPYGNEIMYSCPEFLVFSEDLKKCIGVLELYIDMEEKDYRLSDVRTETDGALDEILKNNKSKKLFCIKMGISEVLLDENSEVICGNDEVVKKLKGQYVGALEKIGLAVTMDHLTDPDNLVEVKLP